MSHLFGQAFVSSKLLATAPAYAPEVRKLLSDWGKYVKDRPRPRDHPIVLAVILASESSGEGAAALPFFSKVFMRQNVQQIRAMGFKVFTTRFQHLWVLNAKGATASNASARVAREATSRSYRVIDIEI